MLYKDMKRTELQKLCGQRFESCPGGSWGNYVNGELVSHLIALDKDPAYKPGMPKKFGQDNGTTPPKVEVTLDGDNDAAKLVELLSKFGGVKAEDVTRIVDGHIVDVVTDLNERINKRLDELAVPTRVVVDRKDAPSVDVGLAHKQLPLLVKLMAARDEAGHALNVFLHGAAGSGKTFAFRQAAGALGYENPVAESYSGYVPESKLLGYKSATGDYVSTNLRRCYTDGQPYLADELDASDPRSLTVVNMMTANGHVGFPDGMVEKAEGFAFWGAANTIGLGADAVYVGRSQLDGATRDRFVFVRWETDNALEAALHPDQPEWVARVQRIRAVLDAMPGATRPRVLVTPRAASQGAALLRQGLDAKQVEDLTVWNKMSPDDRKQVEKAL